MQHLGSMLTALITIANIGVYTAAVDAAPAVRPNILLIFTDDHGWADLGIQGVDKDIYTPHIDQLAREGVRFTRGYVTAPQCTPSRAGVITGTYQQRLDVEENGKALQRDTLTLPERLKNVGYVNGISGKWHLDVEKIPGARKASRINPDLHPRAHGFDEYFTGFMQDYEASHALDGTPYPDAPRKVRENGLRVTIQTQAALSFLDRRSRNPAQPWFLYLAWMAPHTPLESPEPWFSRTPVNLPLKRRQALALIAAMDEGLGKIRAKLKAMGQEKNTLIFFIGDNGAPLADQSWDGSLNVPMQGQKGMLSEGGIRVPFIAAWPGIIPGGQVYNHPVISLDVAATAVAQAGLPHDKMLDGVNLLPFLTGKQKGPPHETLFWRWRSQAAIQEYPWKLICLGDRQRLLFNLTEPEGEKTNALATHPEVAARLEAKLKTWSATLRPAGLSNEFDAYHEGLFTKYGLVEESVTPFISK